MRRLCYPSRMSESNLESPPATDAEGETPAAPPGAMARRFRGFLPVVVDVETGGFDWNRHALLEIAAIPLEMDENGLLYPGQTASAHVVPAEGLEIDPKSLEVTGIILDQIVVEMEFHLAGMAGVHPVDGPFDLPLAAGPGFSGRIVGAF